MRDIIVQIFSSVKADFIKAGRGMKAKNLANPKVYLPLLILLLFVFVPPFLSKFYLHVLVLIFMFAAGAEAWNIIGGYGGQLSLGHAAYFGLGAYTSTMLYYYLEVSPWIGMFLGALIAMLASMFIGSLCFRLRGPYFVIATIAMAEVFRYIFLNQRWITLGARGMNIVYRGNTLRYFQFSSKLPYYYIALAMTLIILYITYKMQNSRLGQYLVAMGQNQEAAEAVGIDSVKVKRTALAVSAFFTAFAGTLYAQYTFFIDPDAVFGLPISIDFALFSVVGGLGTLWGPILGTFIVRILTEITSASFGAILAGMQLIIYGAVLMIIVLLKPSGLLPFFTKMYERLIGVLPGFRKEGAQDD
jgi:branched-chain amino acid transport system permease protein